MINGYIFYFLGQLFSGQLFEIFARETNLKKQSSVQRGSIEQLYIALGLDQRVIQLYKVSVVWISLTSADKVGGSKKGQKHADVILEWFNYLVLSSK